MSGMGIPDPRQASWVESGDSNDTSCGSIEGRTGSKKRIMQKWESGNQSPEKFGGTGTPQTLEE